MLPYQIQIKEKIPSNFLPKAHDEDWFVTACWQGLCCSISGHHITLQISWCGCGRVGGEYDFLY